MVRNASYSDGFVDLANKAELTSTGVKILRFPRLTYCAERTGKAAMTLATSLTPYYARSVFSREKTMDISNSLTPKYARKLGAAIMMTALPISAAIIHDEAMAVGVATTEYVQEIELNAFEGFR